MTYESNVPVWFDDLRIEHWPGLLVQENHYDPFGLALVGLDFNSPGLKPLDKYKFGSKEVQTDFGLGWSDFGARMYDPQVGRWWVVDPLVKKHHTISPYSYVYSNPINMIDPDGRDAIFSVTRDKDGEINGVNISSTVYIQGSDASSSRAAELTESAATFFKSKTVNGMKVSLDISYEHKTNN